MPGPPKKPTAIKRLEGNPGHQRLPVEPEMIASQAEDPPDWMPAEGKKLYRSKIHLLRHEVKLASVDEPLANITFAAYGFAVQAARRLSKEGLTKKENDGQTKKHPSAQIFRDMAQTFHQGAAKLGMSPSDRARLFSDLLSGEHKEENDDVLNGNWPAEKGGAVRPN